MILKDLQSTRKACFLGVELLSLLIFSSFKTDDVITFHKIDPLDKVFPESTYFVENNDIVEVAAGEHAVFQFVIRSKFDLSDVKISYTPLKNESHDTINNIENGIVKYIHIGRRTPDISRDVVRSLSSFYPDQIDIEDSYSVKRDIAQPFWTTVSISKVAKPGVYCGKIKFIGKMGKKSFTLSKEIKVKVYPIVMEKPQLWITNWYANDGYILKMFNNGKDVEMYSDAYWRYIDELAKKMKRCYQNVVFISPLVLVDYNKAGDKYSFDFTHFDQVINAFKKEGVLERIEGGHLGGRINPDWWESPFGLDVLDIEDGRKTRRTLPVSDKRTQNFYRQFMPALMSHLKEKCMDKCYIQHIGDEPIDDNVKSYIENAKFIKSLAPTIKTMDACHTHNLDNVLDIWVPQLNIYNDGYEFYKERQKAGDEVWYYTCCGPQGEYANRFIELPLLKVRLLHWINFRFGATGFLHWGFDFWGAEENPNKEASRVMTGGTVLPGGDCWIVYPNNGKLNGSLRLEAMRDGVEDYTLLKMLEKKNPQLAQELCKLVVNNWQQYDLESYNFRQIRHRILEALSN